MGGRAARPCLKKTTLFFSLFSLHLDLVAHRRVPWTRLLPVHPRRVSHALLEVGALEVVFRDVKKRDVGPRQRVGEAAPGGHGQFKVFAYVDRPDAAQAENGGQAAEDAVDHAALEVLNVEAFDSRIHLQRVQHVHEVRGGDAGRDVVLEAEDAGGGGGVSAPAPARGARIPARHPHRWPHDTHRPSAWNAVESARSISHRRATAASAKGGAPPPARLGRGGGVSEQPGGSAMAVGAQARGVCRGRRSAASHTLLPLLLTCIPQSEAARPQPPPPWRPRWRPRRRPRARRRLRATPPCSPCCACRWRPH